jgi:pimeloyl-ACP methyl ester carboxylesterase
MDQELAERFYMIAIDRPGYGYSSYGEPMTSIKEQAEAVVAAIPDHAILVGHSYGGPVAAAVAMYFPEKVRELVLLAPAVDPEHEKQFWINQIFDRRIVKWTLSGALQVALEEKLFHIVSLEEILHDWDLVQAPVTVVHGKKDNIVPYENSPFLQRVLTGSQVQLFSPENMNHIMIWTKYDWVKELILSKAKTIHRVDPAPSTTGS